MAKQDLKHIGEVAAVSVYPVKSMRGCALDSAHLGWQGLDGDRRYAFVRSGSLNGLPWVSARQLPALVAYATAFEGPEVQRAPIAVETPRGDRLSLRAPELAEHVAEALGVPVHLMRLHRGAFDAMPVSIVTLRSIETLALQVGHELDVARFRANIVIDSIEERPYPEEKWVGRTMVFGHAGDRARVHANRRDERCSIVNVNPETGVPDLPVHRAVVSARRNFLGIYGSPERPGEITVGTPVFVTR